MNEDGVSTVETARSAPVSTIDMQDLGVVQREFVIAVRRVCPAWLADEADDLVQDAMMKLVRMHEGASAPAYLTKSYIKRIAYSVVVDEMRRRQRRPEQPEEAVEELATVTPDSDSDLATSIEDCLTKQKEDRRRAVTLHLLGHNVTEIARLLDFKLKKAENLVYRALAHLRDCLIAKGVYP